MTIRGTDAYARIMAKTVLGPIVRPELSPCLDSTYRQNGLGYVQVRHFGRMTITGRIVLAHKMGRPLRDDEFALHHCDRPHCVNEDHLYAGTYMDNTRDRKARFGNAMVKFRGENHPRAVLTVPIVRQIKQLSQMGLSVTQLCQNFGFPQSTIRGVVIGRTWREVEA